MRQFTSYLFNGNGDISEAQRNTLKARIDEALSINSAREQGGEVTAHEVQEVIDVVKDVAAALLGRRITIGSKLTYPGKANLPVYTGNVIFSRKTD